MSRIRSFNVKVSITNPSLIPHSSLTSVTSTSWGPAAIAIRLNRNLMSSVMPYTCSAVLAMSAHGDEQLITLPLVVSNSASNRP